MKKDVIIVTPLYRNSINKYEEISLDSMFSNFEMYDTALCIPESLDETPLTERFKFKNIERFDNSFFKSIYDYNRLMMWDGFYERFSEYEYILICQADVFIFRNDLQKWIEKGFDYIGAPWISTGSFLGEFLPTLNKKICERLNPNPLKVYAIDRRDNVGNGGFSLRKVSKFTSICKRLTKDIQHTLQHPEEGLFNEDLFFSVIPQRRGIDIKKPTIKEALDFAFDIKPDICLKENNGRLPMAAHGWFVTEKKLRFWSDHITF